jgi:hypothetical protein
MNKLINKRIDLLENSAICLMFVTLDMIIL